NESTPVLSLNLSQERIALSRSGSEIAITATTGQVVHGDIEKDVATGGFDVQNHGFGVLRTSESFVAGMNFRRKNLESVALIVEQGNRVSDDHVGEFADRFARGLLVGVVATGK